MLYGKGASIITIDDGRIFRPDDATASFIADKEAFSGLSVKIKAERGNEALDKVKADGKQFGRPLGKKKAPEKNVLYGKSELLEKLLAEGVSKSEIARRLDVSRGTVVNYLADLTGTGLSRKITRGSRNTGKLTAEQLAIATDKGWVLG